MAIEHGVAGEWARVRGTVRGLRPCFLAVFLAGFSLALTIHHPAIGLGSFIVILFFVWWSRKRGMLMAERYFKGARGEEKVATILRSLPARYHIFNDFLACGVHVDHVVVGPNGVFAVETKFWRGKVTIEEGCILVDGVLPDRPPLAQVKNEAALVKTQLEKTGWKGDVTPILTFASDTFYAQPAEIQGTVVINSCELKASFESGSVILSDTELDRLVGLMENN